MTTRRSKTEIGSRARDVRAGPGSIGPRGNQPDERVRSSHPKHVPAAAASAIIASECSLIHRRHGLLRLRGGIANTPPRYNHSMIAALVIL